MYQFEIEKMTCMNCVRHIEAKLKELDKALKVKPDLKKRTLEVNTELPRESIRQTIHDAGYEAKDLN